MLRARENAKKGYYHKRSTLLNYCAQQHIHISRTPTLLRWYCPRINLPFPFNFCKQSLALWIMHYFKTRLSLKTWQCCILRYFRNTPYLCMYIAILMHVFDKKFCTSWDFLLPYPDRENFQNMYLCHLIHPTNNTYTGNEKYQHFIQSY